MLAAKNSEDLTPFDVDLESRTYDLGLDPNLGKTFTNDLQSLNHYHPDEQEPATGDSGALKEPFTIFSSGEKYALTLVASFLALFSSISVPIYLPVLTELEHVFHVTTEQINLTIVTYSIFQGVSPAFWGPLADNYGRRTIYPLCVIIYIGANIGLALASNYGMLLGFRCLQAAGMAAAVALGAGLVGDITQRKDRGTFVGIFSGLTLVGNALGPLIGAGLADAWGWRAIFWFLVISAGAALVILLLVLPETNRSFVGNGSVKPKFKWSLAPSMILLYKNKLIDYDVAVKEKRGLLAPKKKVLCFEQSYYYGIKTFLLS